MRFVTVTELRLLATQIVSAIEETGEEVVVTKRGKPVVVLGPVDEAEFKLKPRKKSALSSSEEQGHA